MSEQTTQIRFSKTEATLVKHILRGSGPKTTALETTKALHAEFSGEEPTFRDEELYPDDPPTPDELLAKMKGQRLTGMTQADIEALQTCITVYTYKALDADIPFHQMADEFIGIQSKIRGGLREMGYYDHPERAGAAEKSEQFEEIIKAWMKEMNDE